MELDLPGGGALWVWERGWRGAVPGGPGSIPAIWVAARPWGRDGTRPSRRGELLGVGAWLAGRGAWRAGFHPGHLGCCEAVGSRWNSTFPEAECCWVWERGWRGVASGGPGSIPAIWVATRPWGRDGTRPSRRERAAGCGSAAGGARCREGRVPSRPFGLLLGCWVEMELDLPERAGRCWVSAGLAVVQYYLPRPLASRRSRALAKACLSLSL